MNWDKLNSTEEINLEEIENALIKNRELERYVKFVLGKSDITSDDLVDVKEIILDSKNFHKQGNYVYFEDLKLFPNLKSIRLFNLGIGKNEIEIMKTNNKIEELSLNNCSLYDGLENLKKIKSVSITNSIIECIDDFKSLNNLEEVVIENSKFDNYEFLKDIKKLKRLYFMNMDGKELEKIPELEKLEFLSLCGIDTFKSDDLNKFKNLKTLSIGKDELGAFSEVLNSIEQKGIKIFVEDAYDGI